MIRLKELRQKNNLKRSDLAKALNLPQSTVANYENESRQMPYSLLITFADFFNVTVDYLLGRTDDCATRHSPLYSESGLTAQEKQLIGLFRNCTPTGKSRTTEYCNLWVKKGK